MSLAEKIKSSPRLKKFALWLIASGGGVRPRWWVRTFVNPFYHKKGPHTRIFRSARIDAMPFNSFEIGSNSTIEAFSFINNGMGPVSIGNGAFIGAMNVIIGPVRIGNDIMTAQNVVMSGLNHGFSNVTMPFRYQPCTTGLISIGDGTWVGANSVITAGVTVGRFCVIAAGSVVTKDVPDYSIAAGNPARVIKQFNHQTNEWERAIPPAASGS
ncbi:MAG TPA: acyltransferase [Chitinophagaceae bacterium]|nr:acyltransferase [Chitinophagaceae bacterium]